MHGEVESGSVEKTTTSVEMSIPDVRIMDLDPHPCGEADVDGLDDDAGTHPDSSGEVVDQVTGMPRVLGRKCATCIYRPGNLMNLRAGRREWLEAQAIERNGWIVCHCTLPAAGVPRGQQAICRGYADVAADRVWPLRWARGLAAERGKVWPDDYGVPEPAKDPTRREVPPA